jgi:hypothetical protein
VIFIFAYFYMKSYFRHTLKSFNLFLWLEKKIEKRDWKERKRIEAPKFSCLARREIEMRKKKWWVAYFVFSPLLSLIFISSFSYINIHLIYYLSLFFTLPLTYFSYHILLINYIKIKWEDIIVFLNIKQISLSYFSLLFVIPINTSNILFFSLITHTLSHIFKIVLYMNRK